VGADQVRAFDSWRDPEGIVEQVRLAIFDREGASAEAEARALPASAQAVLVQVPRVDVSSTQVRARARAGLDIAELVPPDVHAIIERERLYSSA
jgi:nicotinate-nucleotide adenylyltransferase